MNAHGLPAGCPGSLLSPADLATRTASVAAFHSRTVLRHYRRLCRPSRTNLSAFPRSPGTAAAANSVAQSTVQVTTLVAPGPAGLCIKAFCTAWVFFIDAVSFLFIIGALWRLPDPPSAAAGAPRGSMFRSIFTGLHYVKSDVALMSLMLVVAVLNFAIVGPISIGIAVIAEERFGTALAFGLLMSRLPQAGLPARCSPESASTAGAAGSYCLSVRPSGSDWSA
jgi:hypothetical protein